MSSPYGFQAGPGSVMSSSASSPSLPSGSLHVVAIAPGAYIPQMMPPMIQAQHQPNMVTLSPAAGVTTLSDDIDDRRALEQQSNSTCIIQIFPSSTLQYTMPHNTTAV
jgi:hypothetical protein